MKGTQGKEETIQRLLAPKENLLFNKTKNNERIKNMGEKYRVVVLGFLKNLNTEKEVVEEYRKYLSTIFFKKRWSFYCKQEKQTMAILSARLLFEEL